MESSDFRVNLSNIANQYLDSIPVNNVLDLQVVLEALKSIAEPNRHHAVPPDLEGRIKKIKEAAAHPQKLMGKEGGDPQEAKQIILDSVTARIEVLEKKKKELLDEVTSKIKDLKATKKFLETKPEETPRYTRCDDGYDLSALKMVIGNMPPSGLTYFQGDAGKHHRKFRK